MKNFNCIIVFLVFSVFASAQQRAIDSLIKELRNAEKDTSKIRICSGLVWQWRTIHLDSARTYAALCMDLAEKNGENVWLGRAHASRAMIFSSEVNYKEAINSFSTAGVLFKIARSKQEEANCYVNLGWAYSASVNYPEALEYDLKALKLLQELNNEKSTATVLGNIGIIYNYNHDPDKAIKYTEEALVIDSKNKNMASVARHLGNLGTFITDQAGILERNGQKEEAKKKFLLSLSKQEEALKIYSEMGNISGMAMQTGNMASNYLSLGDTIKMFEYYKKSLESDSITGNREGLSRNSGNIAWAYMQMGKYALAESYFQKAISIAYELNNFRLLNQWHNDLTEFYERTKHYDSALVHHKAAIAYRDSIYNIDNARKTLEAEMNFEFEKKEAIAKEENEKQTLYRNIFIAGFAAMFIMAILILRSYRIKQKANKVVSEQKELLEIKNKEITDSILYAKRIQNAHLPSKDYIAKKLSELKKKV